MTIEQNKATMRRFLEAAASDHTAVKELLAPDFVAHLPGGPANHEGFLQQINFFGAALGNQQFTINDIIAEEDKVVVRTTFQATHSGEFMGLPPTGKQITISAFIIDRIQDGKIVEHWSLFDNLSLMQQLGAIPIPGEGGK